MAVCSYCLDYLAPKSRYQLEIRKANMAQIPESSIMPCPRCSGTEWATTGAAIEPGAPEPTGWLGRLHKLLWRKAR